VDSTPKKRTTFTFYLPASSQKAKKDELDHGVSEGCGKILIMDDQKVIRTTLKKIFEKVGYEVETAEEGHQAIQKYKKAKSSENPFDLVILDLTIPGGLGGLDTFTTLKMIDPNVVAVVTSGYSTDPVLSEPRKFGFYGTLKKPFKMDEAMKLIKDILEETNKI
jgi:DNA-binding NtrC family response regulator